MMGNTKSAMSGRKSPRKWSSLRHAPSFFWESEKSELCNSVALILRSHCSVQPSVICFTVEFHLYLYLALSKNFIGSASHCRCCTSQLLCLRQPRTQDNTQTVSTLFLSRILLYDIHHAICLKLLQNNANVMICGCLKDEAIMLNYLLY